MKIPYHNLVGLLAILLGFYFLIKDYKFLTIIVGALGLAVVLYGMKENMPKLKRKKK